MILPNHLPTIHEPVISPWLSVLRAAHDLTVQYMTSVGNGQLHGWIIFSENVGGIPTYPSENIYLVTPLKKMFSLVGMIIPNIWKKTNVPNHHNFPTIFGPCACSVEGSDAPQALSTCLAPLAQVKSHCWVLRCYRQRSENLCAVNTWPCKLTHQPRIHRPQRHRIPRKRNSW